MYAHNYIYIYIYIATVQGGSHPNIPDEKERPSPSRRAPAPQLIFIH